VRTLAQWLTQRRRDAKTRKDLKSSVEETGPANAAKDARKFFANLCVFAALRQGQELLCRDLTRFFSDDQELLTEDLPRERQFEIQLQKGQRRGRPLRH
jgi:hypothetical protein